MRKADRRALAKRLALSTRLEVRYVRDLQAVFRRAHATFLQAAARGTGLRLDASRTEIELGNVEREVFARVREDVGRVSVAIAHKVVRGAPQLSLPGLEGDVTRSLNRIDPGMGGEIAAFRDENIALVENALRVYARDVREVITAPENVGLRVEELRDQLLERGNVSESRAALIARDQTLKLHGQVTQLRQQRAGVRRYVWSSSRDERVRETHAAKEGEEFEWNDPPPDTGHPGQDFQCRCVAIPIFEDEDA